MMDHSQKQDVAVVIVGAGLSGLRAATELEKSGIGYIVLEAMDRVGGRTFSVPTSSSSDPGLVEMGAAWLNDSNQSEMYSLSKEFGFELVPQVSDGLCLYQDRDGKISKMEYGVPVPLTENQKVEFRNFMTEVSSYVERSDLQRPHLGPDAERLDSMTARDFITTKFGSGITDQLLTLATRALLGVESDELSALCFIDYVKSGMGFDNIISDHKHGAQYLRNANGNQNFAINLAARLKKGRVKLSEAVKKISQTGNHCMIETDQGYYRSERVIVSVPSNLYSQIEFEPDLPLPKQILRDSKMGYYSKTILVFSEPWWRHAGLSGEFSSEEGTISFTRDTSVPELGKFTITCFHAGNPGRNWSLQSEGERQARLWHQFHAAFQTVVNYVPKPIKILEKEWSKDPWVRGNPMPVMVPGVMSSSAGQSIRDPFGNIHFVGTETSFVWKGYMEGAVRSGVRGAAEVIEALRVTVVPKM